MSWHLRNGDPAVNQKRIRRLMRLMGKMPIHEKPNTCKPAKGHKTSPCLLGAPRVDRPNQVWCADITWPPVRRGFLYWSRSWTGLPARFCPRISNALEADVCVEALNEAANRLGPPEIMNTD